MGEETTARANRPTKSDMDHFLRQKNALFYFAFSIFSSKDKLVRVKKYLGDIEYG